jgi:hypothetical protein
MEEIAALFVPIAFFAMIAGIVILPRYFKSQERTKLADTLRIAIEKGQPIPPEMIEAMARDTKPMPLPSPDRDLRRGIVWLGMAVGLAAFGGAMSFEEPDWLYPMIGIAAFPGFIGLAFIVIALFTRGKR